MGTFKGKPASLRPTEGGGGWYRAEGHDFEGLCKYIKRKWKSHVWDVEGLASGTDGRHETWD